MGPFFYGAPEAINLGTGSITWYSLNLYIQRHHRAMSGLGKGACNSYAWILAASKFYPNGVILLTLNISCARHAIIFHEPASNVW